MEAAITYLYAQRGRLFDPIVSTLSSGGAITTTHLR